MMIVTSNGGKFKEYEEMFSRNGIEIDRYDLKYPEEQLKTVEEVAKRSAYYLTGIIRNEFFIDDTGLFIDALGGFPGVYSSYVQSTIGNRGILKLLDGIDNRRAKFRTAIAYFDGDVHIFSGEISGTISLEIRGSRGFGYDPIFIPDGKINTYAEMTVEEKNMISHRSLAVSQLLNFIKKKKI